MKPDIVSRNTKKRSKGGGNNWASEASPTLGCSIEISRDIYIYICRYVCRVLICVGGIKYAHAQSQFLGSKN